MQVVGVARLVDGVRLVNFRQQTSAGAETCFESEVDRREPNSARQPPFGPGPTVRTRLDHDAAVDGTADNSAQVIPLIVERHDARGRWLRPRRVWLGDFLID